MMVEIGRVEVQQFAARGCDAAISHFTRLVLAQPGDMACNQTASSELEELHGDRLHWPGGLARWPASKRLPESASMMKSGAEFLFYAAAVRPWRLLLPLPLPLRALPVLEKRSPECLQSTSHALLPWACAGRAAKQVAGQDALHGIARRFIRTVLHLLQSTACRTTGTLRVRAPSCERHVNASAGSP